METRTAPRPSPPASISPPSATASVAARAGAASPSALSAESASDDHLLDLVSAFPDREDLGVAVEAAHGVLLDVAVAALDLHRLLGGAHREPARLELGLRGVEVEVPTGVLQQPRLVDEHPARLDLRAHVGELGLDGLELGDHLAERLALLRAGGRLVEGAPAEPE